MVLINLHRNLHEKSSFLSEIMFIRINPYLCHLLTRYQSTIFPNHKSCVRKKGVPLRRIFFLCDPERGGKYAPAFSVFLRQSVCFSLSQSVSVSALAPAFSCVRIFVVSPVFSVPAVFLSLLFAVAPVFPESLVPPVSSVPSVPEIYLIITALTIRTPERRFSSSLSASRW